MNKNWTFMIGILCGLFAGCNVQEEVTPEVKRAREAELHVRTIRECGEEQVAFFDRYSQLVRTANPRIHNGGDISDWEKIRLPEMRNSEGKVTLREDVVTVSTGEAVDAKVRELFLFQHEFRDSCSFLDRDEYRKAEESVANLHVWPVDEAKYNPEVRKQYIQHCSDDYTRFVKDYSALIRKANPQITTKEQIAPETQIKMPRMINIAGVEIQDASVLSVWDSKELDAIVRRIFPVKAARVPPSYSYCRVMDEQAWKQAESRVGKLRVWP